jgi:hypothetical protein
MSEKKPVKDPQRSIHIQDQERTPKISPISNKYHERAMTEFNKPIAAEFNSITNKSYYAPVLTQQSARVHESF